jgi:hypothetical protein
MGNYLSCLPIDSDMDAATLGHTRSRKQSDANYFRYVEECRFHNEKTVHMRSQTIYQRLIGE